MATIAEKIRRLVQFFVPVLLILMVFILSNQQFFFVDDDLAFDGGSAKIKTAAGHLHLIGFPITFCGPNQSNSIPILVESGNIPSLTTLFVDNDNLVNVKRHAPPANLSA